MSAVWTLIDLLAGRRDGATLSDRDWEGVISVARAEALAATLAERLSTAALPEAVAALFADLRAAARLQQRQALWEAEMARRALEPAGVRFILLKGAAYAAAGLANAAGRQIGDLDILVARADLDRAERALLAAGWEWVKSDPYDDAYYRNHMHELPPLIHKARDRMIDVHHSILPLTHRAKPDPAGMMERAVPSCSQPGEPCERDAVFLVLDHADRVIHCAAHVIADGDLAGGLRNLWDFHLLLAEFDQLSGGDWPALIARAEQHQLAPAVQRACVLATHLYGTTIPRCWFRMPSLSDRLFLRALTARDAWGRPTRPFTRLAFYIRSHWLRMPPLMLLRHLWIKWRRG